MEREADRSFNEPRSMALLWVAVLIGPIAWFLHQQVGYGMATFACGRNGEVGLHVVTGIALLIIALGAIIAWRSSVRLGRVGMVHGDGTVARSRFMALGAGLSSLFFTPVIIAQWVPTFFLRPCQ
jgi:hypothetical protein